ncbi:molybdenum cofactor guanylyltransferase MobA [Agitococcus lubricus]|nr:molybdenum cofactor guanylyltransferase MobA [Agitococcus lubricus]
MNPVNFSLLILAGGKATRMQGQDKGLVLWQGKPLVEHIIGRIRCTDIVISCNRNHAHYHYYGRTVSDQQSDFWGPLAGIASGLAQCQHDWVLVVACDMPSLPHDIAQRLANARQTDTQVVIAHDGEHLQSLCFLARKDLYLSAQTAISKGQRAVYSWLLERNHQIVYIDDAHAFDNINRLS